MTILPLVLIRNVYLNEFHIQTPQQLASHLRSLRKAAGLTQAELGRRLGVEQARVAKIERNPGSVSVHQLLEVLNALGASVFLRRKAPETDASKRPPASW
jgi:HTH-type transcriptional regulator/antitoxin HipB